MDIPLETLKERIKGQRVVKYLLDCRFKGNVYLVGGAIRELCLNNTPKDYDLALSDRKDLNKIEHLLVKAFSSSAKSQFKYIGWQKRTYPLILPSSMIP